MDITDNLKPLNTPGETAAFLGKTVSALANERYLGIGIPFIRVGRSIRYARVDIAAHLAANRFTRTDEKASA